MGIRFDIHLEMYDGRKLNDVEKYEIERKINIALENVVRDVIEETIPSYMRYKGSSHKLVGHKKAIVDVLKSTPIE